MDFILVIDRMFGFGVMISRKMVRVNVSIVRL